MKRGLPAYVEARKGRKGQTYLYFRRGKGATIRIHSAPGTPDFAAEYARLLKGIEPVPPGRTFRALIASYKRSDRFSRLKPRTRADYEKVLAFLEERLGALPAHKMRRKDVVRLRDSNEGRFANYCVQVIRVLMEHAMDQGWRDDNPAKGVNLRKLTARPVHPWPAELIAAYRAEADGRALLLFELLLGTGQRIGDVRKMLWTDIAGDMIRVSQGKTSAELWIPITPRLQDALRTAPRLGETILSMGMTKDGKDRPLSYRMAHEAMMKVRLKIGAGGEGYGPHSLRHTAASQIAAMGLDDEHIMAVTGHTSRASVARYAGAARQRARAKKAQEGRE